MAAKSAPLSNSAASPITRTFGDIAPVLVHDFKGPLSAIVLNLDFVLEQLPQDASFDGLRNALCECRHAGDRIFRVIANLLDVARCEEGRLTPRVSPVSIPALFERVLAEHEAEGAQYAVRIGTEASPDLPSIDTDVDLFVRILHNLLDNALRNARHGGTIVLAAHVAKDAMEIRVKNDGPPIPLPVRSRLFARTVGVENAEPGMNRGLGLYFCRLALEELGGSIALADEADFPVSFVIRYPLPAKSIRPVEIVTL